MKVQLVVLLQFDALHMYGTMNELKVNISSLQNVFGTSSQLAMCAL